MAGRKIAQLQVAHAAADEAQGGVANGGGHAPHLAVFSLGQLDVQPSGGNGTADADGWIAGRDLRGGIEHAHLARAGPVALDGKAATGEAVESGLVRNAFDLDEIAPPVAMGGIEQQVVEAGFVAEKQKPLGIEVQPAKRIDPGGKIEFGEGPLAGLIGGELA